MPTPTTSLQILNDIRDTIGNLVERHKTLSTAETTTPADLKEIDKELGDCLNLLLSVDTGLSALMSNDFNLMLQNGNTMVSSIEQKIELITTALNAFDEVKITALNGFETSKQEALTSFGEAGETAINSFIQEKETSINTFEQLKSTVLNGFETSKQEALTSFGEAGQTVINSFNNEKQTVFIDFENEKNQALQNVQIVKGDDGLSAYQIALNNGFVGTELEFLGSLNGDDGLSAYEIALNNGYIGTQVQWLASLKGQDALPLSDSGWVDLKPYLVNGWLEYSASYPIAYRKIGNIVFLKGLVSSGNNVQIFNLLPVSIRPLFTFRLPVFSTFSRLVNEPIIATSGAFTLSNYDSVYTSISCSYLVG